MAVWQQEPHPPVPSARQLHLHWLVLWVAERCSAGGSWEVLGWPGAGLLGGGEACTHTHIDTHCYVWTLDFTLLNWCLFNTMMYSHTWMSSPNICKFNFMWLWFSWRDRHSHCLIVRSAFLHMLLNVVDPDKGCQYLCDHTPVGSTGIPKDEAGAAET